MTTIERCPSCGRPQRFTAQGCANPVHPADVDPTIHAREAADTARRDAEALATTLANMELAWVGCHAVIRPDTITVWRDGKIITAWEHRSTGVPLHDDGYGDGRNLGYVMAWSLSAKTPGRPPFSAGFVLGKL